jgi:enamine deaminase RidA (YjgF/YER057c/UK114 family)
MPITTIDPPELAAIPGSANISVATGSRIVHIAGQTGVDRDGQPVGATLAEQAAQSMRNLRTAVTAAGCTTADIAMLRIYVVDYDASSLDAIIGAAIEVFGEDFPVTASTLLGVATLFQPELLIEIDAMLIAD